MSLSDEQLPHLGRGDTCDCAGTANQCANVLPPSPDQEMVNDVTRKPSLHSGHLSFPAKFDVCQ